MSMKLAYAMRNELLGKPDRESVECASLPFERVVGLLDTHPLISVVSVSKLDVHRCMIYMLTSYKDSLSFGTRSTCFHCGGSLLIQPREHEEVCHTCGVVQSGNNFDRNHCVGSVSVGENDMVRDAAQHWNAYVCLPVDKLQRVIRFASVEDTHIRRTSFDVRIVSAFVLQFIDERVPVREGKSMHDLPIFIFTRPVKTHTCIRCGEAIFGLSAYRRHRCFEKKERQQWSCVQNKRSRLKVL